MKKSLHCLCGGLVLAATLASTANAAGLCFPDARACDAAKGAARAAGPAQAMESDWTNGRAVVAPIDSSPGGQTYGRWATQWYQWAIGVPAAVNPVLDATGADCAQRQVGQVWFLAGSFGAGSVTRACTVPAGKALFFPLINTAYFAFLNDPPETRTPAFVRAAGSCTEPAEITVWIDGAKVPRPTRNFTGPSGSPSPLFNAQMPPGNILGADEMTVPELFLGPSAEQGYYLYVQPLRPGAHEIRWIASGCTPGSAQDITYHLTVDTR